MVRLALATVIALTAVCFVSGTSWAGQTDSTSFRIQDYIPVKFTDFGWKLDGGARLEGNYADTISTARRSFGSSTFSINRELQVGSLNLGSNWLYQFETPATLFRSEIGADFTYDNQKDSRTNGRTNPIEYDRYLDEVTEKIGAVDLSFSGETRKFVYSNAFLSGKLDIAYVYNDERTTSVEGAEYLNHVPEGAIDSLVTTEERDRQRSLTKDMTLAGELLVGYGRSYEGRHASMALFMAEELSGKNLLIRNPDRNQMRELSDLIRRYRLQHSPDAREHRTAALSAIAAHFAEWGLVERENPVLSLVLEDVWDYYPTYSRRFGSSVSFGFGGNDHYESIHNARDLDFTETSIVTYGDSAGVKHVLTERESRSVKSAHESAFRTLDFLSLHLETYRPLALRWQWDCHAIAKFYIDKPLRLDYKDPEIEYDSHRDREVLLWSELRYIYDARTELVLSASATGHWWEETDHSPREYEPGVITWYVLPYEARTSSLDCVARVSYRISVPTTLRVGLTYFSTANAFWWDNETRTLDSHGFDLSFGITHWLF